MKKFLSALLTVVIAFSLTANTSFAAKKTDNTKSDTILCVTVMDENGQYKTISVNPDETVEIPIYQYSEEIPKARSTVETATLSIGRSGNYSSYFQFTPKLQYLFTTIGFTGSFSVTNYSGLSLGSYKYALPVMSGSAGVSDRCHAILSGTYSVIGFASASIIQGKRIVSG